MYKGLLIPHHKFRDLVNNLRDVAVNFHNHQSLRQRISYTLDSINITTEPQEAIEVNLQRLEEMKQWHKDNTPASH